MEYPLTQMEFERMFSNEQLCMEYLIGLRWREGYVCMECGNNQFWLLSRRRISCRKCKSQMSITQGTIFEQSNKPLSLWYRTIWLMVSQKSGVSAVSVQNIMGFGSYQTAWTWLHKLRKLTVSPDRERLKGKVEIDETFLGGYQEGKRGRGAEGKNLIAIAVEIFEKGTGRVRLNIIPNAKRSSLKKFIENNVEVGSEIVTDGWKSYLGIDGYKHTVVEKEGSHDEENLLPNAHRVASLLKRWLLGTHQNYITGNKTQNYLDEFVFRYNRRKSASRGLLFQRVMEQAVNHKPIKYSEIINKNQISGKN
jgi:transposase-like protein